MAFIVCSITSSAERNKTWWIRETMWNRLKDIGEHKEVSVFKWLILSSHLRLLHRKCLLLVIKFEVAFNSSFKGQDLLLGPRALSLGCSTTWAHWFHFPMIWDDLLLKPKLTSCYGNSPQYRSHLFQWLKCFWWP